MILPNIENEGQVTDSQVTYLVGLAKTLAAENDFAIQNFADSAVTSPDVQNALQMDSAINFLDSEPTQDVLFDIFNPEGSTEAVFALSIPQENSLFPDIWDKIKGLFSNLRRKVKRIFCKVVESMNSNDDLDLNSIIRKVLLALIPALAASSGLMPVALPIVVTLAAMLVKHGIDQVCPN